MKRLRVNPETASADQVLESDLTTTIETIPIDTIQPFTISHKTKTKMPEMASTEFCNWSNFIKGYFNDKKEKIIFGRWVYGVLHRHQIMNSINGDSIILYSISNFEMGNFSDDGLTDCGDYSIMIIKNQANDKLSFVKAIKEQKQFPNQYVMMAYLKVSPLFKPLHIP